MSSHLRSDDGPNTSSRIMQDLKGYSQSAAKRTGGANAVAAQGKTPTWNINHTPHVVVVGAGVSGLRCAEVLLEGGVQVTVIEGRNRVGGRVHQIKQEGHMLDMGANWIHGTVNNPMVDLAKDTGTVTLGMGEECGFYNEYGCQIFNKAKATELHELVWGIISDAFKYSIENSATCNPSMSLYQFMQAELKKRELASEDLRTASYMAEQWGHFIGDHYSLQSLKYFWLEENIEGENLFVAGSYGAILERIAARARAEAKILLRHRVTTVGTVLNTKPSRTKVYHHDLKANELCNTECDAVVITIPLGCLKHGIPAIHPKPLPAPIAAAIEGLGYGQLEKAYLTFPKAWWATGTDRPNFMEFLHPLYDNENTSNSILDCIDMSLMPGDTAQPTLLFYFHGPLAYSLVTDLEQFEGNEADAEKFLIRRFRPYFSLLPNFDPEDSACMPVAACMTRWRVDPYSMGSYTNFPISGVKDTPDGHMDKAIEALRHGMPERGIYFAGEHTAPFAAVGTVTGAYWSGERVGERIIESFAAVATASSAEVGKGESPKKES